jgi:hypothetical protein
MTIQSLTNAKYHLKLYVYIYRYKERDTNEVYLNKKTKSLKYNRLETEMDLFESNQIDFNSSAIFGLSIGLIFSLQLIIILKSTFLLHFFFIYFIIHSQLDSNIT